MRSVPIDSRQDDHTLSGTADLVGSLRSRKEYDEAETIGHQTLRHLIHTLRLHESLPLEVDTQMVVTERERSIEAHGNLRLVTVQSREKLEKATLSARDVVRARHRLLGQNHPDTLTSLEQLALTVCHLEGHAEDAVRLMTEVVLTRSRILGEEHPSTLRSLAGLAHILATSVRTRLGEAVEIEESLALKYERILGPQHPETLDMKQRASLGRNILHESESAGPKDHGDQSTESRSSYGDVDLSGSTRIHQSNGKRVFEGVG